MDVRFPFPDEETSRSLLEADPEYRKIPSEKREEVFCLAWRAGTCAAESFLERESSPLDFFRISARHGLQIIERPEDNVAANTRYYSEFFPREQKIFLYNGSIRLWCAANSLSLSNGKMLILSHEFFHFLESTELGWTSQQYKVPAFQIGRFSIGKVGCPSLSEIAANAFAYSCFPYLQIDDEDSVILEGAQPLPEKSEKHRSSSFWNTRKEELRELYDQFFKF